MESNLLIFVWFPLLILSLKSDRLVFKRLFTTWLRNSAISRSSLRIGNGETGKQRRHLTHFFSGIHGSFSSQWGMVSGSKAHVISCILASIIFISVWRQLFLFLGPQRQSTPKWFQGKGKQQFTCHVSRDRVYPDGVPDASVLTGC